MNKDQINRLIQFCDEQANHARAAMKSLEAHVPNADKEWYRAWEAAHINMKNVAKAFLAETKTPSGDTSGMYAPGTK